MGFLNTYKLRVFFAVLILSCLTFTACTKKDNSKTVWIYTSIYKNVIAEFDPLLKAKFPDVKFEWFQSGSENVAARLNAELSAGRPQADLILTSDPLWYMELKKAGKLLAYESPAAGRVPKQFKDPNHAFVIVRMPVAVIGAPSDSAATNPKSWKELTDPKWKGKVSMGSPLESGTSMLLTAQLLNKYQWEYFTKMRSNELLAAGGNSAVVSRMETKERPIGMLLLENILEAKKKNSPIDPVYPTDGVILVPSPMAILKDTSKPELAKQIYDYFLSDEIQKAILRGRMYSPIPGVGEPEGAKPFQEVLAGAFEWSPELLEKLYEQRETIKKKFNDTVLH